MGLWSMIFGGGGKEGKPNGRAVRLKAEPKEGCPKRKRRRTTLRLADQLIAEEAVGAQIEEEDEVQRAIDQMRDERQATVTAPFMETIDGLGDVAQVYLQEQSAEESAQEEEHHDGREEIQDHHEGSVGPDG
ncbi:hypothetical protein LCGC14_0401570 [marine sediment metagenome]|uniref:Uncharacterized protein n=1 Tax=marine sediment metagenome TaxID=412755 RepID=A0A0F9T2A6_9ZZZZ